MTVVLITAAVAHLLPIMESAQTAKLCGAK